MEKLNDVAVSFLSESEQKEMAISQLEKIRKGLLPVRAIEEIIILMRRWK